MKNWLIKWIESDGNNFGHMRVLANNVTWDDGCLIADNMFIELDVNVYSVEQISEEEVIEYFPKNRR